jgi:CheY-like chemotaxis protein
MECLRQPATSDEREIDFGAMGRPGLKVLIVDESPGIRELYRLELADRGYEVVAAGNVEGAEETVGRENPDLIVFDPWAKGRYAWDAVSRIKERHCLLPLPLCLVSYVSLPRKLRVLSAAVVITSPLMAVDSLKETDRITGPLYKSRNGSFFSTQEIQYE